jgi:hypothetical protein
MLWIVAIIFAAAIAAAQYLVKNANFIGAYLCAWWFWLGISLGCCAHSWIFAFTGGRWGTALQPYLIAASQQLRLLALLYLPLLMVGNAHLYPWVQHVNPWINHSGEKSWWLNLPFFSARSILYLALWIALSIVLERNANNRRAAAIGFLVYGFSVSFAAFDWLMSLLPQWYATGFGLLVASGQLLSAFAFAVAAYLYRSRESTEIGILGRDFGNLLLTYVLLWAYLAYTQFLIIWAENLPHEIIWYLPRSQGFWFAVGIGSIALYFALPFPILLWRDIKQNSRRLFALALLLLFAHMIDSAWLILPSIPQHLSSNNFQGDIFSFSLALIFTIGIGALWLRQFQIAPGNNFYERQTAARSHQ